MEIEKLRLLVSGATGFVAGSVLQQAPVDWELHGLSRQAQAFGKRKVHLHSIDLTQEGRLREVFDAIRPHAVIHTAALADIDYCEAHPTEAFEVNVELTRRVTKQCLERQIRLIHCSTDTIFDGERAPYAEGAPSGPLNCYARTKVEAEKSVIQLGPLGVVARLSLVIGLPIWGAGNSFLDKMVRALSAGRELEVPANEIRTPIDVMTLGQALLELASNRFSGIIHLAGNDSLSRFEMAKRVASCFGYSSQLVKPTDSSKLAGRAPRPRDVSLDNRLARTTLKAPMLGLDDALSLIRRKATH